MFKHLNKKTYISIASIIFLAVVAIILTRGGGGEQETSDILSKEFSREAPQGENVHKDTDYGFSFFHSEDFNVGVFSDEENTKIILVQNTEKNIGVQIYISAFDEDIGLTAERIKKEIPDLVMKDVKKVFADYAQGVYFESANGSLGESREIWFVHKMNLYQLSAPVPAGDLLDGIVKSWKWN